MCVCVILWLTDMSSICQRCKLNKQANVSSVSFAQCLANDHWDAERNFAVIDRERTGEEIQKVKYVHKLVF